MRAERGLAKNSPIPVSRASQTCVISVFAVTTIAGINGLGVFGDWRTRRKKAFHLSYNSNLYQGQGCFVRWGHQIRGTHS